MIHIGTLNEDTRLHAGQRVYSPNRTLELVFQGDGNLVLYRRKDRTALWATNTDGQHVDECVMQGDGNLVLYGDGQAIWASGTHGHDGASLHLQNDGNLVIYGRDQHALWASDTHGQCPEDEQEQLQINQKLTPGQSTHSREGRAELILQEDGNLVLYRTADQSALWATNTDGQAAREVVMQADGNLVLYDVNGSPLWASDTYGKDGAQLKIQDDGNLCLYRHGTECVWASQTHGRC
ncbi:hypothetical protein BV898_05295 [Hypsibius exemplaris]|uniref:Bulb-type lectin domain-containing protein n=1 Tax=Hypsibius exemplaris TaxID=2072580 RepID=A0A1W0X050_HYPEX|nr:hypothetical protein BV898_05295 [Hypsibius exemplaris]